MEGALTVKELRAALVALEKVALKERKLSKKQFEEMDVCINQVRFEDLGEVYFKDMNRAKRKKEGGKWVFEMNENGPKDANGKAIQAIMEPVTVVVLE